MMTQNRKKWTTFLIVALMAAMVYGVVFSWIMRAQAAEAPAEKAFAESDWNPEFLKGKDLPLTLLPNNWEATLPDFPAYGSQAEKDEIVILKYLANLRFGKTVETINAENISDTPVKIFTTNGLFDPAKKPATDKLLAAVLEDSSIIVLREKHQFHRLRPSQIDPSLELMFPYPGHPAYPSGHAAQSMTVALVLASLDPTHAKDYLDLAKSIGRHREIAGIHYPSDTEAGFTLAGQILDALGRSEKYKELYGAAALEFKA